MAFRSHIGVALLSASVLAFQLALMQVFSYTQWYHFASFVISVALLGFGTSGVLLSMVRRSLVDRADVIVPRLMILSGLTMACAVPLSQTALLRFDSYRVFVEGSHLASLLLCSVVLSLPFLFAALAIGLVFMRSPAAVGRSYFSNMLGSGLGAPVALLLMWVVTPHHLAAVCGIGPVTAGLLSVSPSAKRERIAAGFLMIAVVLLAGSPPGSLRASEYKSISRALQVPNAHLVMRQPSPHGLVEVVSSPTMRYAPGLSFQYKGTVPVLPGVFSNGEWSGPVFSWSRADTTTVLDYSTEALPYVLGERPSVMIVRAGTGMHAAQALSRGAGHVIVVEPHSAAAALTARRFAQFNDSLFFHPSVSLVNDDVRSFIASSPPMQNLIMIPAMGDAGGGGAYALREDYVVTLEAFLGTWDLLTPDGAICVSTWMDHPPRSSFKLLATLVRLLELKGVPEPRAHLAAVRSWGIVTVVVTRQPLTGSQCEGVRRFCRSMLFDPLLLPGIRQEERNRYNRLSDNLLFDGVEAIVSRQTEVLARYPFRIQPATDDRPFFYQFLRFSRLSHVSDLLGLRTLPFFELGYVILWLTFALLLVLSLGLLLVPVVREPASFRWLTYFGALGLGYILVEMVLMQKLVLLVGHPVYAAGGVLCALLGASGVGSLVSSRIRLGRNTIRVMAGIVSLLLLVYAIVLGGWVDPALKWHPVVRVVTAVLLAASPGFLMGFLFPLGIRSAAATRPEAIPLAWGANGFLSVVGAPLATIAAVEAGFGMVLVGGALCYAIASISAPGGRRWESFESRKGSSSLT